MPPHPLEERGLLFDLEALRPLAKIRLIPRDCGVIIVSFIVFTDLFFGLLLFVICPTSLCENFSLRVFFRAAPGASFFFQ